MQNLYLWLNANPLVTTSVTALIFAIAYWIRSRAGILAAIDAGDKASAASAQAQRAASAATYATVKVAAVAAKAETAAKAAAEANATAIDSAAQAADTGAAILAKVEQTHDSFNGNVKMLLDRITGLEKQVSGLTADKANLTAAAAVAGGMS